MSALATSPHVAIRASAGSGKTYQLTNRYLGLLIRGAAPETILATTFTRKAAGEILGRVLTRLAKASLNSSLSVELGKQIGVPDLTTARVGQVLRSVTGALHRLRVSTIDSFFSSIARSFSLELGFPAQWQIVSTSVADAMQNRAIEASLRGDVQDMVALVRLLSKGQYVRPVVATVSEIVDSLHGTFLDAPAFAWQALTLDSPSDPTKIESILRQLEECQTRMTLPGSISKALAQSIEHVRAKRFREFVHAGLGRKVAEGQPTYRKANIPEELKDLLQQLLEQVRTIFLEALIGRGRAIQRFLTDYDEHLRVLKQTQASYRFGDVARALATASLLGRLDEVYFRLDCGIHHLLLDEFQDTSLSQWQVLRPLAQEVAAHASMQRSVLLVGDVKQAIYGWRGGVADIFDSLDQDLPGLTWVPLHTSYRSSQPIIDTVNDVFEGLGDNQGFREEQAAARAWQAGFQRHTTAKTDLPGFVRLQVAPFDEQASAPVRQAADLVQQWVKRCPGVTIAVLTRTNDAVRKVMAVLREKGIPASEEGGNPITDSAAVGLMLSLLRLADHPGDSIARHHLANSVLGEALGLRDDPGSAVAVSQKIRQQIQQDGFETCLRRWSLVVAPHCDAREARRLTQLLRLANQLDQRTFLRIDEFIEFASTERVEDPATSHVRVMTIHKAKGLQFDIVILPDLDKQLVGPVPAVLLDSVSAISPATRVVPYVNEEEQLLLPELGQLVKRWRAGQVCESSSLLYVALTRAVHALFMLIEPTGSASIPATFAGVIRHALAPGKAASAGACLFEHGDETWFQTLTFPPPEALPHEPAIAGITMLSSPARTKGLPKTSPSSLEGGKLFVPSDLLYLDTSSLRMGSIIHALFEQITWLEEQQPRDEILHRKAIKPEPMNRMSGLWYVSSKT